MLKRVTIFDLMRSKWKEILTGGAFNDPNDPDVHKLIDSTAAAATNSNGTGQWDTMNKSPQRTSLWDDLTSTTASAHITSNYNRIKTMAKAYGVIGSPFYGDEALRDDIVSALEWMYVNRYNETKTAYDNWWDWELGTPMELNDIMVIMFDALSVEQVDKFSRAVLKFSPAVKPSDTGANRVWRSTVLGLSGVLNRDGDSIVAARDGLSDVFLYVNSGDGFYEDGSFIQHNKHPYNGGYGKALLGTIANIMYMLNGSPWEITDPNKQNVYRWVKDSFEPLIYNGAFMDMVRGREVSRLQSQDHVIGHLTISAIIQLAKSASPADKLDFERMAKKWILNDGYRNYIGNANLGIISEAKALILNPAIPAGDKLMLNKVFPAMDRVVHHTEDFAFGLSLSSSRTFKYESINKENLKGWYTSDGMTYLYNGDQSQYSDDFWATVNPYRLPGTTVDTRERLAQTSANYAASNLWAGGSVMEDVYGIAGLDLDADGNQLTAKKSWFMFDDEIVALGAGITSNENRTIETIVENRKLNQTGNNVLTVNGAVKLGTEGSAETMSGTNWAHLAGKAPDSDIGYYFPGGAQIKGLREKRTGAWSDINQNSGTPASITNHFLNLWFDHGVNPNREEYAYVLLPKRDAAQTAAYSETPDIQIVKNTEEVQAVRENKLGIIGANFWAPGRVEYLKTYQPASIIVKEESDQLVVSISDPTQAQEQIIVELSKAGTSVISQDPSITVLNMSPVKIAVNTAGSQGSTHTIRIAYDPSLMRPDKKLYPVADAYVDKGNPNASFGTSPLLAVNGGDPVQETFLRFNLDSLSGEIDAAALKVYGGVSDPQGVTVQNDVYAVLQNDWTETGAGSIAWLNRPQFGLRLGSFDANETAGWADVNVTDYVRTQHTGDHKAGFAITQSSPGLYTTISSKEGSDPEVHPYLAVKEYMFNGAQLDRIQASIVGPDVLKVGTSTGLTISGTKEDGSPADLTQASVAYSSSDPSVISVDGSGIVTALRAGSGTITVMVSLNNRVKSATVHFIATTNGLETQEIVAVADSYVDKSNPNNNYGIAVGLPVTSNGASTREAYFKFDLSQVQGKVHTAKLKIWATNSDAKGGMKENKVYQTGNNWNESTITWNNTPARGALLGSANIDPGWKWHEIDVTSAVYGQVDQTGNFSFLVRQEGEARYVTIFSKEKTSERPHLVLQTYSLEEAQLDRIQASIVGPDVLKVGTSTGLTISGTKEDGSPADLTQASVAYSSSDPSVISVDGSGIVTALRAGSGTITVTVSLNNRVKSATVHFIATTNGLETQEIVAVADSYVDKSNPNNNYGSAVGLPVTSNGASTREAYFKFDLSQVQGKVHTAKLKIWATNSDAKGGMKENKVYQTGNNWNESTITWNNTPARGVLLGSANIDPGWKWHEIDVTSAVYGQVDQAGNFSFLVRQEGEARYVTIFSKEKTSERPHLVLQTYSLEEDKPPVEGISARVSGTDSVQVGETFDVEYGLTGVAGKQKLRH